MTIVLGHISALEYWLGCRFAPERPRPTSSRFDLPSRAPSETEIRQLATALPSLLSSPIHLLVSSAQGRSRLPVVTHVVGTQLPSHAFVRIEKNVFVAAPELAFALCARDFDTIDRVRLGYELCGGYSLSSNSPDGFLSRPPLTSPERIAAFLEAAPRLRGRVSAARAVGLVLAPSASPAETRLAMVFCLPHLQGGLGMPNAELNKEISLTPAWRRIMRCAHLRCDMLWPEQRVCVEYDSDAFHTGSEKINADSLRRNALLAQGIDVITVTRRQFNDRNELIQVGKMIAKRLGTRIQPRCRDFEARHQLLRDTLFSSPEWEQRRRTSPLILP